MKISILIILTVLLAACSSRTRTKQPGTAQKACIEFADSLHDFGTFAADSGVRRHLFIFKNVGAVPAAVVDVRLSCHCLSAEYTRSVVQPGDTGHVTLLFDGRQSASGFFDKTARVRFNSPKVQVLRVRGIKR